MVKKNKPLPATAYMVLGLLSFGAPMSGYEIRKWAQNMHFFYWSPAQSQIYSELNRLEALGFVTAAEIRQEGKPDKRAYQITESGQSEMGRWQREVPPAGTVIKNSLALKLYFGHATTPDVLINMLENFIEETKESLGQMAIVQEYMEDEPTMEYPALIVDWGYFQLEAELQAAQKILARLQGELQSK